MDNEIGISDSMLISIRDNSFLALAMLDDYANVVSKIEGCKPSEVKNRIVTNTKVLIADAQKKLL